MCEPDYRQIFLWAKAVGIEPMELIRVFAIGHEGHFINSKIYIGEIRNYPDIHFEVIEGKIKSIVWDIQALPIENIIIESEIEIENLLVINKKFALDGGVRGASKCLSIRSENLKSLFVEYTDFTDINCDCPNLRLLCIRANYINRIDISNMPKIEELDCSCNSITKIILNKAKNLKYLDCSCNKIRTLSISYCIDLIALNVFSNELTEIDLSSVIFLRQFWCFDNKLETIDARRNPLLEHILADDCVTLITLPTVNAIKI